MEILNNRSIDLNPNASDSYGAGWKIMWDSFVVLLVVTLIYGVISGPSAMFQWKSNEFSWSAHHIGWFLLPAILFAVGFGLFIAGPISYSVKWVCLRAVRGEKLEIRDMFAVFQRNYWNAMLGNLVVGIIVGLGILMLIVPGIIFACRLAFVPYLVIDREMELTEALTKSWDMTKGYGWQIFFMGILAFFIVILGLICLFFGVIISSIWINTAFAAMYQAVVEKDSHFQEAVVQ